MDRNNITCVNSVEDENQINPGHGRGQTVPRGLLALIFFSAQLIKIISHYKTIGYNINVLQQIACLVVNPIMVGKFAFLFNCIPVGRTLWRFRLQDLSFDEMVGAWCFGWCQAHRGLPVGFPLLQYSALCTVESLSLLYLVFYILIYMFLEMMHG